MDTVNKPENYNILFKILKDLSNSNLSIKKLYEYVERNEGTIHLISKQRIENLQKTMFLAYFNYKKLQHQLIMGKPLAVVLDNYSVHHAIVFTRLCNVLNKNEFYEVVDMPIFWKGWVRNILWGF